MLALIFSGATELPAQLNSNEQAIVNLMKSNPQQGRPFLKYDPILEQVARWHANDMAKRGYFSHTTPEGVGPNYLVRQAGYPLPSWWGTSPTANYIESIGAGYTNPTDMWMAWMNSPEHKTHILGLNSFFATETSYGVAQIFDPTSQYGYYWVIITAPPPPLTIDSPANGSRFTTEAINAEGSTDGSAASVVWRVENAALSGSNAMDFQPANGTQNWNAQLTGIVPGKNTLRVRALDEGGETIMERATSFTFVLMSDLSVSVSGSGHVTASFSGTTVREVGAHYTIVATPAKGYLFAGWSGDISAAGATLQFTMQQHMNIVAHFIPNPFPAVRGFYNGLIDIGGTASGFASISSNAAGAFSGRVVFRGASFALTGHFDPQGNFHTTIRGRDASVLDISLHMDLTDGTNEITGTLSLGGVVGDLRADRLIYSAHSAAPQAGRYTITLPPDTNNPAAPQGNGWARLLVGANGIAALVGNLADGTAYSRSIALSASNTLPVFIPLAAHGSLGGTLIFENKSASDLGGVLTWSKPSANFTEQIAAAGSAYTAPSSGSVLNFGNSPGNAIIAIDADNLSLSQSATLTGDNTVTPVPPNPNSLALKITPANGMLSGSFVASGKTRKLRGIIVQKQNAGFGFFLDGAASGAWDFTAAP